MDIIKRPKSKKSSSKSKIAKGLTPEKPKKIPELPNINPHDISIFTKLNSASRGQPKEDGKFKLFCTGTFELMFNGIDINLDMEMNPNQCRSYILEKIKSKELVDAFGKELYVDIYLPGGIPFIGGKLSDLYNNTTFKAKPVIYGVLYRRNKNINNDVQLNQICFELCNASNIEKKGLISPLCESSDRGLADMACLLGYISKGGYNSDKLIKASAAILHFPPLVIALNRIFERCDITGHDVIIVTSSLFTYFRYFIPSTVENRYILEFALRCCTFITYSTDIPTELPILTIEIPDDTSKEANVNDESAKNDESKTTWNCGFLRALQQPKTVYFWQEDVVGVKFDYIDLRKPEPIAIEYVHNLLNTFKPIRPLSIQFSSNYQIVKGNDYNFLYLTPTPVKDPRLQNSVEIANPMTGMVESIDIYDFISENQDEDDIDDIDTAQLVDRENVEEIIDVCFDESGSMNNDIDGNIFEPKNHQEIFSRLEIAVQYLSLFANRAYGFRISCILGLISFNQNVKNRCSLSPLVPNFENKGLSYLAPKQQTHLYEAISKSCDRIIKYTRDKDNNTIFPNAKNRILVISDGVDSSGQDVVEIVKKLRRYDIMLDSIILCKGDECKMLATLCHLTGGLSFKSSGNFVDDLKIFEQSAFLCSKRRLKSRLQLIPGNRDTIFYRIEEKNITNDFINKINQYTTFDNQVISIDANIIKTLTKFSTPKHVCYVNKDRQIPDSSHRRILRELHYAALVNDPKSTYYDSDMVIYTNGSALDQWAVFIKGPVNSYYENKWWYLFVSFPPLYPCQPPTFRFVSIPYHLNVSSEGLVCLNLIDKSYISTMHVIDILQQIKQIFLTQFESTPVSIGIFDTYYSDKKEYERLARKSTHDNAKDDIKDYFPPDKFLLNNEFKEGYSLDFSGNQNIPQYMVSQISGKLLKKENMILSSTNVLYDRDELRELLRTHINPVCVITGLPLTDDPDAI